MAETFDLDDFDNPPPPPRFLYKYLSAERVGNVLEGGTVRFTPLINTNDTFEVRSTFEKLAGPKFILMLSEQMDTTVSGTGLQVHGVSRDYREPGDRDIDRDRPLFGVPVIGAFALQRIGPGARRRIGEEGLNESRVGWRGGIAFEIPQMVGHRAKGPGAGLFQHDARQPRRPGIGRDAAAGGHTQDRPPQVSPFTVGGTYQAFRRMSPTPLCEVPGTTSRCRT